MPDFSWFPVLRNPSSRDLLSYCFNSCSQRFSNMRAKIADRVHCWVSAFRLASPTSTWAMDRRFPDCELEHTDVITLSSKGCTARVARLKEHLHLPGHN